MISNTCFISEEVILYLEYLIEKNTIKPENLRPEYYYQEQEVPLKPIRTKLSFRSYLKKDNKNNYYITDKKSTIKCYFNIRTIKKCLDRHSSLLLIKNTKNLVIDVKDSKIDIRLNKSEDKILLPTIIIIINEFKLEFSTIIPYSFLNIKHRDVNLDADVDKNIRRFLSIMKKNNLVGVNNKETDNKVWYYSGIPPNEIIELSNIKFNRLSQIEFINCDISGIDFNSPYPNNNKKENNDTNNNESNKENNNFFNISNINTNNEGFKSEKDENKNSNNEDSINNSDLIKLFFALPSQKKRNKKDFSEYENIEINLLGKKRTREKENNILNDSFEENLENTRRKTGPKKHKNFNFRDYMG